MDSYSEQSLEQMQQDLIFRKGRRLNILVAVASFSINPPEQFTLGSIHQMSVTEDNSQETFAFKQLAGMEKAGMIKRIPTTGIIKPYIRLDVPAWHIIHVAAEVFDIKASR